MLYETFPEMRSQQPGEIEVEHLPNLRNIVLIDNEETARSELEKLKIRSLVDWREVMIWKERAREKRMQHEIEESLGKDDVINLQFTRYGGHFFPIG